MAKGLFITGTGTDVGKTYVTALLAKAIRESGINCGYYKAALSGATSIDQSDAGYVNKVANIGQEEATLLSYLYENPLSPHLAAKVEGNPVEMQVVEAAYEKVCQNYSHVLVEGSGGIICPIRYDDTKIMLLDIVKTLDLPTVIVAHGGLGTINATVLTIEYLKQQNVEIQGVILNFYDGSLMHQDNKMMIENLTNIPVIATVNTNGDLQITENHNLEELFA